MATDIVNYGHTRKYSYMRKQYSPHFKAMVALEAFKGSKTTAQLSREFGIHPNLIRRWKKRLQENASTVFSDKKKNCTKNK